MKLHHDFRILKATFANLLTRYKLGIYTLFFVLI